MNSKNTTLRLAAAVAIISLAVAAYVLRPAANTSEPEGAPGQTAESAGLPRLLDLGADKCIPCKMMAPILDEMGVEFEGVLAVDFIDVWKNPSAAKPYGIKVIPTQIFFAPDGTELYRHEGFIGREGILAKWRELGVKLPEKGA
jgi:thioredoxin 1